MEGTGVSAGASPGASVEAAAARWAPRERETNNKKIMSSAEGTKFERLLCLRSVFVCVGACLCVLAGDYD